MVKIPAQNGGGTSRVLYSQLIVNGNLSLLRRSGEFATNRPDGTF
jgi:hypothetical protein